MHLSFSLLQHVLSVLGLHSGFSRPGIAGWRLSWQRIRELHEQKLLLFAVTPHLQQVRQGVWFRDGRWLKHGLRLLHHRDVRRLLLDWAEKGNKKQVSKRMWALLLVLIIRLNLYCTQTAKHFFIAFLSLSHLEQQCLSSPCSSFRPLHTSPLWRLRCQSLPRTLL